MQSGFEKGVHYKFALTKRGRYALSFTNKKSEEVCLLPSEGRIKAEKVISKTKETYCFWIRPLKSD